MHFSRDAFGTIDILRRCLLDGQKGQSGKERAKSGRKKHAAPKPVALRLENLEERALLSVVPSFAETLGVQDAPLAVESFCAASEWQTEALAPLIAQSSVDSQGSDFAASSGTLERTSALNDAIDDLLIAAGQNPDAISEDFAFNLSSCPESTHTIYLDFNGNVCTDAQWTTSTIPYMDGALTTPPYDVDGNLSSYSNRELRDIYEIWLRVSEDFMPFNVNVTTKEPTQDQLDKTGNNDVEYGVRVAIGGSNNDWLSPDPYDTTLGVACTVTSGSFGKPYVNTCFVFSLNCGNSEKIANCVSHEVGHPFGLWHDGTSTYTYYSGHLGWGPIMGNPLVGLTQWSKGEYPDGDLWFDRDPLGYTQDDLSIISSELGYRADDHGNSVETATPLTFAVEGTLGSGIIERNTDVDFFSLSLSGERTILTIGGVDSVTNLDAIVKLYNSSGDLIATFDPLHTFHATIDTADYAPGDYYLSVAGSGKIVGDNTVYTDYGSLGAYTIKAAPFAYNAHDLAAIQALGLAATSAGVVWDSDGRLAELTCSDSTIETIDLSDCEGLTSLDVSGCANLKRLDCYNCALSSLDVSGSANLEELRCYDNASITSLNASDCAKLTCLDCHNCSLSSLDVSECANLEELRCYKNLFMVSLNVSGCTRLTYLSCYGNSLASLDVSGLANLETLDCSDNALTLLDVSGLANLETLDCSDNALTWLDVSNNANLATLFVGMTNISTLNLTSNVCLSELGLSANLEAITTNVVSSLVFNVRYTTNTGSLSVVDGDGHVLELSKPNDGRYDYSFTVEPETPVPIKILYKTISITRRSTTVNGETISVNEHDRAAIEALGLTATSSGVVWNNEGRLVALTYSNSTIDTIDLSDCEGLVSLNVSGCPNLKYLDCDNCSLPSLDVAGCPELLSLKCSNNALTELNLSGCANLETLECYDNALTELDVSDCANLKTLNCRNNAFATLSVTSKSQLKTLNVSGCPNLTNLNCSFNALVSLDVTDCKNMTSFDCSGNFLTSLDVSEYPRLKTLDCSDNTLIKLDVSGRLNLETLICCGNALTSLDVSGCASLGVLDCYDNELAFLDLTSGRKLSELSFDSNVASIAMSREQTVALRVFRADDWDGLEIVDGNGSPLTSAWDDGCRDVELSPDVGAPVTFSYYRNGELVGTTTVALPAPPDQNDLEAIWALGLTAESEGVVWNAQGRLTRLTFCDETIEGIYLDVCDALTYLDVSGCANLQYLDCGNDSLTSLNASGCGILWSLDCSNNALTSLDVSGCENLWYLNCSNNALTSLDVSECWNHLNELNCSDNALVSLNLPALEKLYCSNNAFDSLDLSHTYCLTELDVSGCDELTELDCGGQYLYFLNASGCSCLTRLDCGHNVSIENLNVSGCESLTYLDCSFNSLSALDLSDCVCLRELRCDNNYITSLDVSNNARLRVLRFSSSLESITTNPASFVSLGAQTDEEWGTYWDELKCVDVDDSALEISEDGTFYVVDVSPDAAWPVTFSFYDCGDVVGRTIIDVASRALIVNTLLDDADPNNDVFSLREAIDVAKDGDTIAFSVSGSIILVEGELDISKSITIDASSVWDAERDAPGVTISGNNASRVFNISGENVELIGIKIANGDALDDFGGGVYNTGVLSIRNIDFESNAARLGGAIYNKGTISVTGTKARSCVFSANEATGTVVDGTYKYGSGGGLYNSSGSSTLINVSFSENAAYKYGGAISNFATLNAENIVCQSNEAGAGGALHNSGVAVVTGFSAQDNRASVRDQALAGSDFGGNGGAIFQSNNASKSDQVSTLTLNGSTFENNYAQNAGGAADILSGTATFKGSNEFYANAAAVVGGALVVVGDVSFNNAAFAFARENESNTNDAPFGATVASTSDADALKVGFFGTANLNALTKNAPYKLFDTFVRARTITDGSALSLDFDFFATTSADSVTSVTVLRVDNGEPITVVKGTPAEGEVNAVTLGDLGVNESEWNVGDSIDVYYYVNGSADYKFKLTLTKATNGSMMIQRIDMDAHAASGVVGFTFRTFGYEPVSKWTIDWGERDGNNNAVKSEYTGLGYLWNAFHMYEDEGVKHTLTLSVQYADDRTDSFALECVSPGRQSSGDAILDEDGLVEDFFADEDWVEELFEL